MSDDDSDATIPADDPVATQLRGSVLAGDVATISLLLGQHPTLARARLASRDGAMRTPLHLVADWPGYFPNGPAIARLLIDAGADPDARTVGKSPETPLHWAASSDDVDVAAALIDGGADVEAAGGSIGTPLDNAIGYGCWNVARLLVARGAHLDTMWHAAALGDLDRLTELIGDRPDAGQLSQAFWHACAAGQRRAAELVLSRGAELDWVPDYADGTPLDVAGATSTREDNVVNWLRGLGARSARGAP